MEQLRIKNDYVKFQLRPSVFIILRVNNAATANYRLKSVFLAFSLIPDSFV